MGGGQGGGNEMSNLMSAMSGMGGGMGAGGGMSDMASLMAAMSGGGGTGAGTGQMSPMDMMNLMNAMETTGSSGNSKNSSTDMASFLGNGAGMGSAGGMGSGMGSMEMQMMAALMGGGAEPPDTPVQRGMMGGRRGMGLFGLKKRSAGHGPNPWHRQSQGRRTSPAATSRMPNKKPSMPTNNNAAMGSQVIPDWLLKKLLMNDPSPPNRQRKSVSTPAPPLQPPTPLPTTSAFDAFSKTAAAHSGGSKFTFQSPGTGTSSTGLIGMTGTGLTGAGLTGTGNSASALGGMGGMMSPGLAMAQANPISSNMTPVQIETMFTAIGMIPDQIRDISGGVHGLATMLPEDIKIRAIQMRAMGSTPDQIADILGDVMQARRARMMPMGVVG
ncbi:PE-PGRS family protein PE_PGRS3-like isoform X2 [Mytilus edulis]|uniref:PE-PGRS family protein PE_PGRS3-like isoform X2 n=1 Tax=Mytilus edulis TaxID=6550 RepID=UPI0039F05EFB